MGSLTIEDLFSRVENLTNLERTASRSMRPYRLDRMSSLLDLFGNPQRSVRVVHVAGSKGKGSTAAYIAAVLTAAGFRTGVYASPHVVSYKERISLSGTDVTDEAFISAYAKIESLIPGHELPGLPGGSGLTTFELLTLLAFVVFRSLQCDWAVVETGIGGRLDATNLVSPEISVITPIELEHTDLLGDTIERIASEKAGIIKPGVPVYSARQSPEALDVISSRSRSHDSPLTTVDDLISTITSNVRVTPKGVESVARLEFRDSTSHSFPVGMSGQVQAENAALAWIVGEAILSRNVDDRARRAAILKEGIGKASLPGRMETASLAPPIILDAAHTPSSIERLVETFCGLFGEPRQLLFGSVTGKRHAEMATVLAPYFKRIIVTTPGTFKQSDPNAVADAFSRIHANVELCLDPRLAVSAFMQGAPAAASLVTGSFYLIGDFRKYSDAKEDARVST